MSRRLICSDSTSTSYPHRFSLNFLTFLGFLYLVWGYRSMFLFPLLYFIWGDCSPVCLALGYPSAQGDERVTPPPWFFVERIIYENAPCLSRWIDQIHRQPPCSAVFPVIPLFSFTLKGCVGKCTFYVCSLIKHGFVEESLGIFKPGCSSLYSSNGSRSFIPE